MEPNPEDGFSTQTVSDEHGTDSLVQYGAAYGGNYQNWQQTRNGYRHGQSVSGSVYDTASNMQSDWNGHTGYGPQPHSQTHFVQHQQQNQSQISYQPPESYQTYQMAGGVPFQQPYESYQSEFTDPYLNPAPVNPQPVDTVQMDDHYAIVESAQDLTPATTNSSAYNVPDPASEEQQNEKSEARKISNKESQRRKRSLERRNTENHLWNDKIIAKLVEDVQGLSPDTNFAEFQQKLLQNLGNYKPFEKNERHNKKSRTNTS